MHYLEQNLEFLIENDQLSEYRIVDVEDVEDPDNSQKVGPETPGGPVSQKNPLKPKAELKQA